MHFLPGPHVTLISWYNGKMVNDQQALTRIKRARTALILRHPFFATLSLRLRLREDYNCSTAWTDGRVFGYNPHYINMLSKEKLEGMTAHIVMHPACNHHKRRAQRDPVTWNKACDLVINSILLDAGFTLPDGYLLREELADQSAEKVYDILEAEEEGNSSRDESNTEIEEDDEQHGEEQKDNEREGGQQQDSENQSEEESAENGDPGMAGEVRDGDGAGGIGEGTGEQDEWNDAIIQAAINARGVGKLPASIERLIDRRLSPRLDWRELLARFVERNARSDYSWITPNRRYLHKDLYLPSLRNCEIDNVVIAVDSSGSIDDGELALFGAEISHIFTLYPANIHIIYCDNRIQKVVHLTRSDLPVKLEPAGGGGTDFRPVFSWLEQENIKPSCLIYLTDLETLGYPEYPPPYPVLWVWSNREKTQTPPLPFGEIIPLS